MVPLRTPSPASSKEVEELEEVEELDEQLSQMGSEGKVTMGNDRKIFDFNSAVENFMEKKDVVAKVPNSFIEKVEGQIPAMEKALDAKHFENLR